jgi:lipoprotein NlpD
MPAQSRPFGFKKIESAPLFGYFSALALLTLCVACSSPNNIIIPAPVVDRSPNRSMSKEGASQQSSSKAASSASTEALNRPGYYTVKPGDTIIHVSLENGQNWKDLVRWNNLENPNLIEVGQVLRVLPPESNVSNDGVVVRPVGAVNAQAPANTSASPASNPQAAPSAAQNSASSGTPAAQPARNPAANPPAQDLSADTPAFIWPAPGKVIANFDESKNKGIDIGGKLGEPVLAAADGKVVYAGSGLRGYGNLIIIKHNNTFLTAYAHNQTLIAKEDQSVKQGQKIAELGNSDSEQTQLHFEIRKSGKPVDPVKWLPAR